MRSTSETAASTAEHEPCPTCGLNRECTPVDGAQAVVRARVWENEFEVPYPAIARALKAGEVVPFLGAGVNLGASPAPDRPRLPSGRQLAEHLATESRYPFDPGGPLELAKVASFCAKRLGRRRLRKLLRQVFVSKPFEPCRIHRYIAEQIAVPVLLVTTNYDTLAEQAFREAGRPFDLVVDPSDRKDIQGSVLWRKHGEKGWERVEQNRLYIDLATTTVIYKMHGSVDPADETQDSFVITEEDYVDFLSRPASNQPMVPTLFMQHFRTHPFLYMGYGLGDWNLRVVLRNLEGLTGGAPTLEEEDPEPSWAIQYNPPVEDAFLWKARNVEIFNLDLDYFVDRLTEEG